MNKAEQLVLKTREEMRREALALALECKDLEEFIAKMKEKLSSLK